LSLSEYGVVDWVVGDWVIGELGVGCWVVGCWVVGCWVVGVAVVGDWVVGTGVGTGVGSGVGSLAQVPHVARHASFALTRLASFTLRQRRPVFLAATQEQSRLGFPFLCHESESTH
jgi:hypothetical protein